MAWLILIVAGLIETGWTVGLKYSDSFTKFWPSVFTILGIAASMVLLAVASRTIPLGTAYAVWVGVGRGGVVVLGIVLLGEPASLSRLFFLTLLIVAVVGLAFSNH